MNGKNEIINKNKISNLPLKEELFSKEKTNYDKKSKFPNEPVQKKIYFLNKNKNIENQNNNYNNQNLKKATISEIQAYNIKIWQNMMEMLKKIF